MKKIFDNISIPSEWNMKNHIQDEYLVNGEIKKWKGAQQDVYSCICHDNAGTLEPTVIGSYPLMGSNEALDILDAAYKAFDNGKGEWPTYSVSERIKCVQKFLLIMKEKKEEIVKLLMWEIGKNKPDSIKEFDRTVEYIEDTIESLKELDRESSRFKINSGVLAQIRRAPLGVILCMGPYNYPLNETFTTLIPALIMGNTIIFKPPRMGVLLHHPLLEAYAKAFPKGVVNTVYGDGKEVISPIMQSGKVSCLAFIGSSKVADILKSQHPMPHRLRSVLGLEAKNPGIVLPDCNLDVAVEECLLGALSFNGQRCTALKILFVHSTVYEQFVSKLIAKIKDEHCGLPWEDGVKFTPLPDINHVNYLQGLISDAVAKGAKIANSNGGEVQGTFLYPTVLTEIQPSMRIYSEEQFGPIVAIAKFDKISTPIDYIEKSNYGQQVALFGDNPHEISSLIDPLVNQVCRVNINSQCQRGPDIFPFTGRKDSAEGTLSVSDALRVFSIRTLVAAKTTEANKTMINNIVQKRDSKFLNTDFIL